MTCAEAAVDVVRRCEALALATEEPGHITRTFLSEPMHAVHASLAAWMSGAGLDVRVDAAGNLRGVRRASAAHAPRLLIGSHLDSVPRAGAFDGVLGVVSGIALMHLLGERRLPFEIEVVGFSEEEGVRFGVPFIGSRALAGTVDEALLSRRDAQGQTVRDAIAAFGLNPDDIGQARHAPHALGYLEIHIEQGPVLESHDLSLGVVQAIAGQTRAEVMFRGTAGHAGTTPMELRRDALAAAAEWIGAVETLARRTPGLVATNGAIGVEPGAGNVIPGDFRVSLDVRHASDDARVRAVEDIRAQAAAIALRRQIDWRWSDRLEQGATAMDGRLVDLMAQAASSAGVSAHRMTSGAGHDAMIMASHMPAVMLFVRSPGGISHHPGETVRVEDVALALKTALAFLELMAQQMATHTRTEKEHSA